MRHFLEDFEKVHNKEWLFGAFPAWNYYPSTGTHIGTDFKVTVGTSIFAPCDGEMFKTEHNQYKGDVGIFIFKHNGIEWGLELCHLREQPRKGKCKEGEIIAYSGNTGSATTGAHLHAVLHRHATVTKNYSELRSREDFLRLQKEGAIVDCFEWFCVGVHKKSEQKPNKKKTDISRARTIENSSSEKNFVKVILKILRDLFFS